MLLEHFFLTLVPTGILLWIGRRIELSETEQAARRAFFFLLGVLLLALTAVFLLDSTCCPPLPYFVMLAATGLIPIVLLQWSKVRTRQTTLILLGSVILGTILGLRYALSGPGYAFMPILMVGGGTLTLAIWQLSRVRSRWSILVFLALALLMALLVVQLVLPNSIRNTWSDSTQQWLDLVTLTIWPGIVPILIGMIVLRLISPRPYRIGRIAAGLIVIAVMVSLTILEYREVWLSDIANDNLGIAFFQMLPALGAGLIVLLLIWKGSWRALTVFALLAVISVSIANAVQYPTGMRPTDVVAQRAAQIDSAIQAYFQDNGTYPDTLLALTPRYLLTLPNAALFRNQTWCYESGADYYRFGYVHRPAFGVPSEFITVKLAGEGGTLPAQPWVCDAQLAEYQAEYSSLNAEFAG